MWAWKRSATDPGLHVYREPTVFPNEHLDEHLVVGPLTEVVSFIRESLLVPIHTMENDRVVGAKPEADDVTILLPLEGQVFVPVRVPLDVE